jgi:hypothetical protein
VLAKLSNMGLQLPERSKHVDKKRVAGLSE